MSAAQTDRVRSPDGDAYIEPKSPSLNSVPPMPGTNARAGPPDGDAQDRRREVGEQVEVVVERLPLTSSPAASARSATYCADAS